jgi:hypothetical protein
VGPPTIRKVPVFAELAVKVAGCTSPTLPLCTGRPTATCVPEPLMVGVRADCVGGLAIDSGPTGRPVAV